METDDLQSELERFHSASYAWSVTCCRGNLDEAEDVLQTAYLKILDGKARFAGRSSVKTWFFSVIRKTAGERQRRRWVRKQLLDRWHPSEAKQTAPRDPHRATAASETSTRIRAALGQLSHRQRQVLDLVFYQDQTVREAAEILGLTIGTARVHYARGKRALEEKLEDLR